MPCGHCGKTGHNKSTCPIFHTQNTSFIKTQKKKKSGGRKTPITLDKTSKGNDFYADKLNDFKIDRKEQYLIAEEILSHLKSNKNVSVKAEEKSGKRQIMECIHCLLNLDANEFRPISVYVTALNRKDTKVQFKEQESYGITSLVATRWNDLLGEIVKLLDSTENTKIYIHLDEDDYGTGDKQTLSKIFGHVQIKNNPRVKFIGYSATPEELEMSFGFHEEWNSVQFIPSDSYFGAKKYLEKGLVRGPSKFFDENVFTEHAIQIIEDMRNNCESVHTKIKQRNVIVVRDTTPKNLSIITSKENELEEKYNCEIYVFDQNTEMKWGELDSWKTLGKKHIEDEDGDIIDTIYVPVVIFISQICTRSTEICPSGHRRIYAWHDARLMSGEKGDKISCYNTLSQAIGRVKHYTQPGHQENNIILYCDSSILEYTLNPESVIGNVKLSSRVKTTTTKQPKKNIIYEDGYVHVSEVLDSDWQMGDPGDDHTFDIQNVDGKWCHYDRKVRYWGDNPPGGGGLASKQQVIQYENETSDRYFIRTAIFVDNEQHGQPSTPTFETSIQSMYK